MYGCETWTVDQEILDGCFTRFNRIVDNLDWTATIRNTQLYGIGIVSPVIPITAKRTMHEPADLGPDIVLWEPNPTSAGCPTWNSALYWRSKVVAEGAYVRSTTMEANLGRE